MSAIPSLKTVTIPGKEEPDCSHLQARPSNIDMPTIHALKMPESANARVGLRIYYWHRRRHHCFIVIVLLRLVWRKSPSWLKLSASNRLDKMYGVYSAVHSIRSYLGWNCKSISTITDRPTPLFYSSSIPFPHRPGAVGTGVEGQYPAGNNRETCSIIQHASQFLVASTVPIMERLVNPIAMAIVILFSSFLFSSLFD